MFGLLLFVYNLMLTAMLGTLSAKINPLNGQILRILAQEV